MLGRFPRIMWRNIRYVHTDKAIPLSHFNKILGKRAGNILALAGLPSKLGINQRYHVPIRLAGSVNI